jgi:ferredoxin-NADP reductase
VRWLVATVANTAPQAANAVSLELGIADWPGHQAGQHVDVRLAAEDGYSAQRSYSIGSRPGAPHLELTVVRLDNGEVSPYLTTHLQIGDKFELRGPIGGYFVWQPANPRPTLLVAGGSGVVPLMSMLRHHAALDHPGAMHLVYSARTKRELLYREELKRLPGKGRAVIVTLTREPATDWPGHRGRVDRNLLSSSGWPPREEPQCFVCGPTQFVEAAADNLVAIGHQSVNIKTERFGPTGG